MHGKTTTLLIVWLSLTPMAAAQAPDCNGNGVDDATDISNNTADDCDGNGVPDVCESSFVTDQTAAAIGAPLGLASADFNADGFLDFAYVDRSSNAAVLLFGDGAGGFTQQTFPAGTLPIWLATSDFNADARPDLAVANAGSNDVSILLNTGAGGAQALASSATVPVGLTPTYIIAVDLDADSDLDLAVAEDGFQAVRTLLNNGQGIFASAGDQQVGFGPISIVAADFDLDGRNDLAVANQASNNLSVLLSGGNIPPATVANFGGPVALATGDFDGDSRPDLAAANFDSSTILILRNSTGDGSFTPGQELTGASQPAFLFAADMNADGFVDLLAADNSGVLAFQGNGDGTFILARRGSVGTGINSLAFAPVTSTSPQVAGLDGNARQVLLLRAEGPECGEPPPPAPGQCGAGACGAGGVPVLGLTLAGLLLMRTTGGRRIELRA